MKNDLYGRMKGWFELFEKRPDVKLQGTKPLRLEEPKAPGTPLPPDCAAFAAHTSMFAFAYKLEPRPDDRGDPDGYLFLSLAGHETDVHLPFRDGRTFEKAVELDWDEYGTGEASFLVTRAPEPFIVWSVEALVVFPSLDAYLQAGARQAFQQTTQWQRNLGKEGPLHARSLPRSTPLPELREALVKRGATPDMADDLIAWLGADVVLLLPA